MVFLGDIKQLSPIANSCIQNLEGWKAEKLNKLTGKLFSLKIALANNLVNRQKEIVIIETAARRSLSMSETDKLVRIRRGLAKLQINEIVNTTKDIEKIEEEIERLNKVIQDENEGIK